MDSYRTYCVRMQHCDPLTGKTVTVWTTPKRGREYFEPRAMGNEPAGWIKVAIRDHEIFADPSSICPRPFTASLHEVPGQPLETLDYPE